MKHSGSGGLQSIRKRLDKMSNLTNFYIYFKNNEQKSKSWVIMLYLRGWYIPHHFFLFSHAYWHSKIFQHHKRLWFHH